MSEVTVLVAAVNKNKDLVSKMNIQTKCIIANQISKGKEEKIVDNQSIWMNLKEKGVGLNRNNALNRCDTKYALLADDDEVLVDGYENIIVQAFNQHPKADVIIFNIHDKSNSRYVIPHFLKVGWLNFARYGAVRIAFKMESIRFRNIHFHQMFGGGCKYAHGEDSIFLADCLRNRLSIVAVNDYIATLDDESESTWFKGYDEKYFYDKGILAYQLFRQFSKIFVLQDAIRNFKNYQSDVSLIKRIRLALKGVKDAKKLKINDGF